MATLSPEQEAFAVKLDELVEGGATLSPEQTAFRTKLQGFRNATLSEQGQTEPERSLDRTANIVGSGLNRGLVDFSEFAGIPVDVMAGALRGLGLPIPDKPFLGSAFNKEVAESILPPIVNPATRDERVLFRIAREAGATLPTTGAAISMAKKAQIIGKGVLSGIRDELSKIAPAKLLAVEQALASSAGLGAGLLTEIFPQGGAASDFIGELVGTFGGSAVASLLKSLRGGAAIVQEAVTQKSFEPITKATAESAETLRQTISGEGSKRQTLGDELVKLTSPEGVEQGVREVKDIQRDIPEFKPTTAQTLESPGIVALERGFEARDPKLIQDFEMRRQQNREALNEYIDQQAPPGDKEEFVTRLQNQRETNEQLLEHSLDRTQAVIERAKGNLSARTERLLHETEQRMLQADIRADEKIALLRPRLTKAETGEIIRREYLEELQVFRDEANVRYQQVDPNDQVLMPSASAKAVADGVERGYRPQVERSANLPADVIARIQALPNNVPFNTLRELRSDILAEMKEMRGQSPLNEKKLRRMAQLLDGVEFNLEELVTDGRLREIYQFQADRYKELVSWYRHGAERLKQGTAAKLRTEDGGGRFAVNDEQVADKFLKGETSVDDFLQALGGRPQAQMALQERIKLDFYHHVVDPGTGKIKPQAFARWQRDREHALGLFPELRQEFMTANRAQITASNLQRDGKTILRNPENRIQALGNRNLGELNEAERTQAALLQEIKQTRKQAQKATASLYLGGNDIDRMTRSILNSSKREQKIADVLKEIGHDPDAKAGFVRALWDGALDKFSVSSLDKNENPTVVARKIRQFLVDNEGWMRQVFSNERVRALQVAKKALARLEVSGRSPQPGGSDTVQKLYASVEQVGLPLLARAYAHQRHVVSKGFIALEQVGRRVLRALGRFTDEQATALLEEAFFDPKIAETLIKAGRGVHTDQIVKRLRLHLLTMNQQDEDDEPQLQLPQLDPRKQQLLPVSQGKPGRELTLSEAR